MSAYVRPQIISPVFRDADGQVIEYGKVWGMEDKPDDSYSVSTHPKRFAPLHVIADALINYLAANFDVEVSEDKDFVADLLSSHDDVIRAVRVTPNSERCAKLTFVYISYPAVVIHAGLLQDYIFPPCGCDACDETWEVQADGKPGPNAAVRYQLNSASTFDGSIG